MMPPPCSPDYSRGLLLCAEEFLVSEAWCLQTSHLNKILRFREVSALRIKTRIRPS